MLKIYNSLTHSKDEFVPIAPPNVGMYVCGMTVYDYCHLGHARVMVVFDVVQRWLRASGYRVTFVRNITDIDDKIIRRAHENGESIESLTARFIRFMNEDADALGVQRPDHEPRATTYIGDMQSMIRCLIERGLAYRTVNGDVNFAVRKFPGYGRLSGKSLDDLRAGERVDIDTNKQDPLDFALWKSAKEGEPFWQSTWGNGRPGWHLECSAMSTRLLGSHFDIHGGGQDLQFPHHENEIAQSEGAMAPEDTGKFVNYWMHNGFVRVDDEKMSKSQGNFFTIREVLKCFDPEVVRFFILRAQYRTPLTYSDAHIEDARRGLSRLYIAIKGAPLGVVAPDWSELHGAAFKNAMDDDFNTPEAVAVLFDLANEVNRKRDPNLVRQLRALGNCLGLLERDSETFLHSRSGMAEGEISAWIAKRLIARQAKNFAEADRIRKLLVDAGIILEDSQRGTEWRRA